MIKNITKGNIVSQHYILCNSLLSQARGMMFRKRPLPLVFEFSREKINALHMMFVFFPIDVIFLDKDKEIVEIKENLRPFSFYNPKNRSRYVVELEKGSIAQSRSAIGDVVCF